MPSDAHQGSPPTWAFLYGHPGAHPVRDRTEHVHAAQRTLLVPVADEDAAANLVDELIEGEGVELIELCGGFSIVQAARVVQAVAGRVPVGHVAYALESVEGAARYKTRFA